MHHPQDPTEGHALLPLFHVDEAVGGLHPDLLHLPCLRPRRRFKGLGLRSALPQPGLPVDRAPLAQRGRGDR